MNLAQAAQVCLWDVNTIDMGHLSIWDRVRHGLWMVCVRLGIEQQRQQSEAEKALLEALAQRLAGEELPQG